MTRRISSPVLVGRQAELGQLPALIDGHTDSRLILLVGDAGIGKTRLLTEWLNTAPADAVLLLGRCPPGTDGGLPYAPIIEALRAVRRDPALATLFAEPDRQLRELLTLDRHGTQERSPDLEGDRRPVVWTELRQMQLFETLLDAFDRVTEQRTVLFVVEDLQWSDVETRQLLAHLTANLRHSRMIPVATMRTDGPQRGDAVRLFVQELERLGRLERIELKPLSVDDTKIQLSAILGQPVTDEVARAVAARSGGNPFFNEELVAASPTGEESLPPGLREMLLTRLAVLPEEVQALLRVLAVLGERVEETALAQVSGLDHATLAARLRAAVEANVLVVDQDADAYAFRHGLMHEALYADLLPMERRELHVRAAQSLENAAKSGREPATLRAIQVAHHWQKAERWSEALPALVAAGRAASGSQAHAEAARLFGQALDIWDLVPDEFRASVGVDRADLLELAGRSTEWAGDLDEALELIRRAIATPEVQAEPARVGRLYQALSTILWEVGDEEASFEAAETAVAAVPTAGFPADRAHVTMARAAISLLLGDPAAAQQLSQEGLLAAREAESRHMESCLLSVLGLATVYLGNGDEGIAQLRKAVAVGTASGSLHPLSMAYFHLAIAHGPLRGCWAEAVDVSVEWRQVTRAQGAVRSVQAHADGTWLEALWRLGRWAEADEVLAAHQASTPGFAASNLEVLYSGALLRISQGRLDDARHLLDEADALSRNMRAVQAIAPVAAARCELELWRGEAAAGVAAYELAVRRLEGRDDAVFSRRLYANGVRAYVERALSRRRHSEDQRREARRLALEVAERLEYRGRIDVAPGLPETMAYREQALAELSRLDERPDAEHWLRVAESWLALDWAYQGAYARWREAEARVAAGGDRQAAAEAAAEGLRLAAELGARILEERLTALCRRARLPVELPDDASNDRRRRPFGLTSREVEVLQLIAAGHSNRQIADQLFISEKTAGVHVSNILAKLDVTGRTQAAAIAFRAGIVEAGHGVSVGSRGD